MPFISKSTTFLLVLVFLFSVNLEAKAKNHADFIGSVRGQVVNSQSLNPLPGVRLLLKGYNVLVEPTELTDKEGKFFVDELPFGSYTLILMLPGFNDKRIDDIELTRESPSVDLGEVQMIALEYTSEIEQLGRKPFINDEAEVSAHNISAKEVITHAGAMDDVARYIGTLPGVVAESEFTSLLYIRGGEASETGSYLDGIYLGDSYHWGGVFTIFNNELIQEIDFYAGGFPAKYFNILSGVLDVHYRTGNRESFHGKLDQSPISTKLRLEGPLGTNKASFLVGARRTYIDVLLKALDYADGDVLVPFFGDYVAKLSYLPTERHVLTLTGLYTEDGLDIEDFKDESLAESEGGSAVVRANRLMVGLQWKYISSERLQFSNELTYGDVNLRGKVSTTDPYAVDGEFEVYALNSDLTLQAGRWNKVQTGLMYSQLRLRIDALLDDPTSQIRGANQQFTPEVFDKIFVDPRLQGAFYGGYVEDTITFGNTGIKARPGVRADYWYYNQEWAVSPRLNMNFPLGEDIFLKLSGGLYHQFATDVIKVGDDIGDPDLVSKKATHALLGLESRLTKNMKLRVEGYYKWYRDVIVNFDNEVDVAEALATGKELFYNDGKGYAYGFDVFWQRKPAGIWDAYASYGFVYTRYHNPLHRVNTEWYYPTQDQRHTISAAMHLRPWQNWEFSFTFTAHSGRPYTEITAWNAVEHPNPDVDDLVWEPVYGNVNSERFPWYANLNVRMERSWPGKKVSWSVYVDVMNAYNVQNIYNYVYEDGDANQGILPEKEKIHHLPILPFIGGSVEF